MVVFLSATIITCTQSISIINRLTNVAGLSPQQRIEIVNEIRKVIPSCPVKIQKDDRKSPPASS